MPIDTAIYCELKHTLTQPNHASKESSYFILEPIGSGQFKVSGVSASGKMKQGECRFVEIRNEDESEASEDESGKNSQNICGSFFEAEQEIEFELFFNLVSEEFVLGSGDWIEYKSGNVRQKYKVVLKQPGLSFDSGAIFSSLLDRENKVSESLSVVEKNSIELSAKIEKSLEKLESMTEVVDANKDLVLEINESSSTAEKTISAGSDLIDTLESSLESFNDAKTELESERQKIADINKNTEDAQKKADELLARSKSVLGESTAAGLSKAFVKRRKQASTLKWVYDLAFLASIVIASIAAYDLLQDYLRGTDGSVQQIIAQAVVKFPVIAMFIWLGVFLSKKSSSMSRLEEFYAQKQVLAESYVGYKAEIEKLNEDTAGHEELIKLMTINLLSIGKDSSEVLDNISKEKHHPLHDLLSDSLKSLFKNNKNSE